MTGNSVALGSSTGNPSKGLNIALWVAQVLLAFVFVMSGGLKLVTPIDDLVQKGMTWALSMPWLPRFIGLSEVAGAVGLVVPGLTKIKPALVGWAGVGVAVIMVLAIGFHVKMGEMSHVVAPAVLLALSVFVAWGRLKKAPIASR